MMTRSHTGCAGFTLVEMLVVLAVLGLLIAALLPSINRAFGAGEEAETMSRITYLQSAASAFEGKTGMYPPSDFVDALRTGAARLDLKPDNGLNSGIESFVVFLQSEATGIDALDARQDWLGNTDGDDNGAEIALLGTTQRLEVLDAWRNPFAYFNPRSGDGYASSQRIRMADGREVSASALRNSETGAWLAPRGFQIISAGADGEFGTEDDLSYPEGR